MTEAMAAEGAAKPLHLVRLEHALQLTPLLNYAQTILRTPYDRTASSDEECSDHHNGVPIKKSEKRLDRARFYNFNQVKKGRKWLKNLLLSDSSTSEDESLPGTSGGTHSAPVTDDDIQAMLRAHVRDRRLRTRLNENLQWREYAYYSTGLLSNHDNFSSPEKSLLANKVKKEQRQLDRKLIKVRKTPAAIEAESPLPGGSSFQHSDSDTGASDDDHTTSGERQKYATFRPLAAGGGIVTGVIGRPPRHDKKLTVEQRIMKRRRIFSAIAKKEIPKAHKLKANARKDNLAILRKVAKESQKEARKRALQSQKLTREAQVRARRLAKEMMVYWKRFDKVEKEQRRRAEKEAQAQRKEDHELKEMKRQQRKLNFLITQTELYAHFMARKLTGGNKDQEEAILTRLDDASAATNNAPVGHLVDTMPDQYDAATERARARGNAQRAYDAHQRHTQAFDGQRVTEDEALRAPGTAEYPQPSILEGKLKGYQLKGMNWLASLYDQGINGILADEMGLGKTIQSIALLAHLAETQGIWGPFLIIAPASTLHNWQQEVTRFLPKFKVVPYWGNTQDRRVLRKFWQGGGALSETASFHVVITSYQLVIQDVKYFSRIKWHYMILDEAQAIKSTNSVRWKILLGFNCRNRLLLTGTPIQNTMQELWALLHFIMPSMFDSHEEFNEWFSKDIESHAEKQSGIDEKHLSRLHLILKPFMLRRCKAEVQNELSDKIEVLVYCPLTARQRLMYQAVKNKIRIEELLQSGSTSGTASSSLMNIVMQFRKVCNHPELFERKEIRSPHYFRLPSYSIPKLVYKDLLEHIVPSKRHLLFNRFYIYTPHNVHSSLFACDLSDNQKPRVSGDISRCGQCSSAFSFTRFTNISPGELYAFMFRGLLLRWLAVFKEAREHGLIHHEVTWRSDVTSDVVPYDVTRDTRRCMLLTPLHTTHFSNLQSSPYLQTFVFTSPLSPVHAHLSWTLHSLPETLAHRKIRLSGSLAHDVAHPETKSGRKAPRSPHKAPLTPTKLQPDEWLDVGKFEHVPREPVSHDLVPSDIPAFLYHTMPKVMGRPFSSYTSDRAAAWRTMSDHICGSPEALASLLHGTAELAAEKRAGRGFKPSPPQGVEAVRPKYGYSGVYVPDKETLVTDAGKLYVLDTLLARLKREGHRVLIYSQMTRMIDILEEYMWHRKHSFIRLDGSSKISERRDMVADFQSKHDLFAFLLSTRAGGLGINLTAADTVIFYDSDWNPTVDQQAMDRAHRLGQTKQVTVYRLICKGTIEERILQRAKEKSEIQKIVISGGDYRPDVLRPKEVISLLLDDDEMEQKFVQRTDEDKVLGKRPQFSMGIKRRINTIPGKKGPGRPKKIKEENVTIPAAGEGSVTPGGTPGTLTPSQSFSMLDEASMDSTSVPPSPHSVDDSLAADDISVDEFSSQSPSLKGRQTPTTPSLSTVPGSGRGSGKKRGRPKGSLSGSRRPRGRGSIQRALHAAEAAAARAGLSKGYAAYGYAMSDASPAGTSPRVTPSVGGTSQTTPSTRGTSPRGRGRSKQSFSPKGSPSKTPSAKHGP